MTVTIYRIERTETYAMYEQGVGYSLKPCGKDTLHYKGSDDGGVLYVLPDGYSVGSDQCGRLQIYNASGKYCELSSGANGAPVIMDVNAYELLVLELQRAA